MSVKCDLICELRNCEMKEILLESARTFYYFTTLEHIYK